MSGVTKLAGRDQDQVLGALLVLHQLGPGHAHHLDRRPSTGRSPRGRVARTAPARRSAPTPGRCPARRTGRAAGWSGRSGSTVNSPRSTPNVLVLPNRWAPPGSQFSRVNCASSSMIGLDVAAPRRAAAAPRRAPGARRCAARSAAAAGRANSGGAQPAGRTAAGRGTRARRSSRHSHRNRSLSGRSTRKVKRALRVERVSCGRRRQPPAPAAHGTKAFSTPRSAGAQLAASAAAAPSAMVLSSIQLQPLRRVDRGREVAGEEPVAVEPARGHQDEDAEGGVAERRTRRAASRRTGPTVRSTSLDVAVVHRGAARPRSPGPVVRSSNVVAAGRGAAAGGTRCTAGTPRSR